MPKRAIKNFIVIEKEPENITKEEREIILEELLSLLLSISESK